jgi:hypothetical protein
LQGEVRTKTAFDKELRVRPALDLNEFYTGVGFHLTFFITKIGCFSAGYVPVGTRDRKSGPVISTQ